MEDIFRSLSESSKEKDSDKYKDYTHGFLVVIYAVLMIASIVLLAISIKGRIKRYKQRNRWGYRSINNDSYTLAQSQLPTTPSAAKGSWMQIYHICVILGCLIRIFSFSICFFEDENERGANATDFASLYNDYNTGSAMANIDTLGRLDISFSFSGSYLFLLTFLIVLCCLAEVYHSSGESEMQQRVRFIQSLQVRSGVSLRNLDAPASGTIVRIYRLTKIVIVFMIMVILATFFMVFFGSKGETEMRDGIMMFLQVFAIVLYVIFFFGFIIYGSLIFKQTYSLLKTFELKSNDTLKNSIHNAYVALSRIIFMVIVSAICFLLRVVVIIIQIFVNENLSNYAWFVDILYYTILEWLPLLSTLIIFVIIPSREKRDDDISIVPIASY